MWFSAKTQQSSDQSDTGALALSIEEMIAMARGEARRLPNRRFTSHQPGDWRDRRRGRGMELESIGPYQPGDDVRHIDWRSSGRVGQTQIKRFHVEIQWTLVILIDLRPSMYFATQNQLMAKTACLAAAQIAFSLAPSHQAVGFVVIDNKRERVLTARRGRVARLRHLNSIVEAYNMGLSEAFDSVVPLAPALTRVNDRLPRSAELVLISDLSYTGDGIVGAITDFGRRSLRLVVVEDSLSLQRPPRGRYPLKLAGSHTPRTVSIGRAVESAQHDYAENTRKRRRQLNSMLIEAGVNSIEHVDADSLSRGIYR